MKFLGDRKEAVRSSSEERGKEKACLGIGRSSGKKNE